MAGNAGNPPSALKPVSVNVNAAKLRSSGSECADFCARGNTSGNEVSPLHCLPRALALNCLWYWVCAPIFN